MCIATRSGLPIPEKKYECDYCKKNLTAAATLRSHLKICKTKLIVEKEQLVQDFKNETKQLTHTMETTKREIKYSMEDELSRIQSEVKSKQDELEQELRLKEEKNRQLEERIKQLEEKSKHPSVVNNHNTYNNNLTIHNYMTPERVTEVFDKHYTIETLMGGQKALANFIVDQFVAGKDKMIYLCVDRSRKKCMYTKDFETFHEDVDNQLLLSQLTPAMRVIKDKVGWTEYEKKYNPHLNQIHESYDEILAIPDDGITFRSQLCKRLPATIEDKERMDNTPIPHATFHDLRQCEEKLFEERKEEVERAVSKAKANEETTFQVELVPNQICGVGLGRLDNLRLLYKKEGVFKVLGALKEAVEADPAVAQAYEDYIKRGTYKGKVIWE